MLLALHNPRWANEAIAVDRQPSDPGLRFPQLRRAQAPNGHVRRYPDPPRRLGAGARSSGLMDTMVERGVMPRPAPSSRDGACQRHAAWLPVLRCAPGGRSPRPRPVGAPGTSQQSQSARWRSPDWPLPDGSGTRPGAQARPSERGGTAPNRWCWSAARSGCCRSPRQRWCRKCRIRRCGNCRGSGSHRRGARSPSAPPCPTR
jgi:hypothetical protein